MMFYKDGLRFKCAQCGKCCRIKEGYVWLSREDLDRLIKKTDLEESEFRSIYTEIVDKFVALKSYPNGDCVFYDEEIGCKHYEDRPLQCRTFPFWPENLRSETHWREAAKFCPGIDSGDTFTNREIDERLEAIRNHVSRGVGDGY